MFSISYSLRVVLVAMALTALMIMPALAGAPPTAAHPIAPNTVAKPITTPKTPAAYAPATSPALPASPASFGGSSIALCPPCEFCGMYPPNPYGPKVASPQLQGSGAAVNYAPSYVPRGTAYAAQPQSVPSVEPNRYVSNMPTPAGTNPSLGEVWMRHGGARLQYDALRGPIQMNTNGRPVKDPALVHLPPLYPTYTKPAVKKAVVQKKVTKPVAAPTAPTAPAKITTPTTHKPVPKPSAGVQNAPKPSANKAPKGTTTPNTGVSQPVAPIQQGPYDGPARL